MKMTEPNNSIAELVNLNHLIKNKQVPLLMEFEVNPDLAPFLVSSPKGLIWIEKAGENSQVRAAPTKMSYLQRNLLLDLLEKSIEERWGNVFPMSEEGVKACLEHLNEFGEIEILAHPKQDTFGQEVVQVSWVPKGCLVFVPKERGYLGSIGVFRTGEKVVLIHNPRLGVAIAYDNATVVE
jgi:hypothetical protein